MIQTTWSTAKQDSARQVLANLKDGAKNDPDPNHRAWCKSALASFRRLMKKRGVPIEPLPAPAARAK